MIDKISWNTLMLVTTIVMALALLFFCFCLMDLGAAHIGWNGSAAARPGQDTKQSIGWHAPSGLSLTERNIKTQASTDTFFVLKQRGTLP